MYWRLGQIGVFENGTSLVCLSIHHYFPRRSKGECHAEIYLCTREWSSSLPSATQKPGLGILSLAKTGDNSATEVIMPVLADVDEDEEQFATAPSTHDITTTPLPIINLTKPPAPIPIFIPTTHDIVALPSPPDSTHSSLDLNAGDLESGLGISMRQVPNSHMPAARKSPKSQHAMAVMLGLWTLRLQALPLYRFRSLLMCHWLQNNYRILDHPTLPICSMILLLRWRTFQSNLLLHHRADRPSIWSQFGGDAADSRCSC